MVFRCQGNHYCYVKRFDGSYIILLLYVDDLLIMGASIHEINKLKRKKIIRRVCNEVFGLCKTNHWDKDN